MSVRKRVAQGFTLVEILIVVVILGILAAIVIPQFTQASESAKHSSLMSTLQTVRSQLELYQVQHNGNYPGANLAIDGDDAWSALTKKTKVDGTLAGATDDGFGPYMQKAPVNPFTNSSTVGAASSTTGWVYDATTGNIKAVVPAAVITQLDLSSADVVDTSGGFPE